MGEPNKVLAMIEDHVGSVEKNETAFILNEAAACIREMVEQINDLEVNVEFWRASYETRD